MHLAREMMLGYKDEFKYGECVGCQCLWLLSQPGDMARYYPAEYQKGRIGTLSGLRLVLARSRNRYAIEGTGLLGRVLEGRRPNPRLRALRGLGLGGSSRILDVGCGDGAVVEDLRLLGYELSHGIDPMRVFEEGSGREPFVERKTLDQMEGVWDAVMFHHSFEHLADPGAALLLVADLLAIGGVCVLRLPIVPCYAWEHYGANWVQLDAPRHLFIHSQKSLGKLSSVAGLKIVRCWRDSGAFQFWGSERYVAGLPLREEVGEFPVTRSTLREYARAADRLNRTGQGDQAAFVLRKAAGCVRPN